MLVALSMGALIATGAAAEKQGGGAPAAGEERAAGDIRGKDPGGKDGKGRRPDPLRESLDYGSAWGGFGGGSYGRVGSGAADLYGTADIYGDRYGGGYDRIGGLGGLGDRGFDYGSFYGDRGGGSGGAGVAKVEIDDCGRMEVQGTPVAEALREVADLYGDQHISEAPEWARKLVDAIAAGESQTFFLTHCPQAVILAALLRAPRFARESTLAVKVAADSISALLLKAPTLRAQFRPAPIWTGQPWEEPLNRAQRRTGIVLLPTGNQAFHIDIVSPEDWAIYPHRRCAGRRDLGNLQATPLETCLRKCAEHQLCKSATFWRWQPAMFGFEQRCFLSSTCTQELATGDGAEGAVLFEFKPHSGAADNEERRALLRRTLRTPPGGAPWSPRCGHRLVAGPRLGKDCHARASGCDRLFLLGGVGVDPFTKQAPVAQTAAVVPASSSGVSGKASASAPLGSKAGVAVASTIVEAGSKGATRERKLRRSAGVAAAKARRDALNASAKAKQLGGDGNVIEAYLSRHVELSGDLPPLRSLPYGRLGDLWSSDDLGATWSIVSSRTPWGPRAFFEAIVVNKGEALLVLGGVRTNGSSVGSDSYRGLHSNDIWWGELGADSDGAPSLVWRELKTAPWAARGGFRALLLPRAAADSDEELVLLGGRLATGVQASDVWVAQLRSNESCSEAAARELSWQQLTAEAAWPPREDFAAVASYRAGGVEVYVLGGAGAGARPLSDVWRSTDLYSSRWELLQVAAPWGPRVGLAVAWMHQRGLLMVFGGYEYPDAEFGTVAQPEGNSSTTSRKNNTVASTWASRDGVTWAPMNTSTTLAWTMHATLTTAPCSDGSDAAWGSSDEVFDVNAECAYVSGGLTPEGYYDNQVHRIALTVDVEAALDAIVIAASATCGTAAWSSCNATDAEERVAAGGWFANWSQFQDLGLAAPLLLVTLLLVIALPLATLCHLGKQNQLNSTIRRIVGMLTTAFLLGLLLVLGAGALLLRELRDLRTAAAGAAVAAGKPPALDIDTVEAFREALNLPNLELLLRLALREPFGYDAYGGYGSTSKSGGYGLGGAKSVGRAYDAYDRDFGYYGLGGRGEDLAASSVSADAGKDAAAAAARELAALPTTQSLSCRSPRCDRNASACSVGVPRSLTTPYGCCGDYMMLMMTDVMDWLEKEQIPYFMVYGTLLGALRDNDILPWTQDMDVVVDRSYWPRLQRGLEAAEFFGGRRYLFGVDQWEERVSRVCADWEGFATSTIGGPDADRFSRGTEFHLDIYASDWWQVKDLHLIDCVEPLSTALPLQIRGRNFSAPARPRACAEKLYGAEWRIPKKALSGVN